MNRLRPVPVAFPSRHAALIAVVVCLAWAGARPASGADVVCRAYVPSADRRHGEVRLVRAPDQIAVQTLLYSHSLRRGVRAIQDKESAAWPPDRDGYADSQEYLDVLAAGRAAALQAYDDRTDRDDPRQKLLIEVVLQGDQALVRTSVPELTETDDGMDIRATHPAADSPVSTAYARAAMERILQSAFHRPDTRLDEFLTGEATRFVPLSESELNQPSPR